MGRSDNIRMEGPQMVNKAACQTAHSSPCGCASGRAQQTISLNVVPVLILRVAGSHQPVEAPCNCTRRGRVTCIAQKGLSSVIEAQEGGLLLFDWGLFCHLTALGLGPHALFQQRIVYVIDGFSVHRRSSQYTHGLKTCSGSKNSSTNRPTQRPNKPIPFNPLSSLVRGGSRINGTMCSA